jgi:hypothetical protein
MIRQNAITIQVAENPGASPVFAFAFVETCSFEGDTKQHETHRPYSGDDSRVRPSAAPRCGVQ